MNECSRADVCQEAPMSSQEGVPGIQISSDSMSNTISTPARDCHNTRPQSYSTLATKHIENKAVCSNKPKDTKYDDELENTIQEKRKKPARTGHETFDRNLTQGPTFKRLSPNNHPRNIQHLDRGERLDEASHSSQFLSLESSQALREHSMQGPTIRRPKAQEHGNGEEIIEKIRLNSTSRSKKPPNLKLPQASSGAVVLGRWLKLEEASNRKAYWEAIRGEISIKSLPVLLLQHLHYSENPDAILNPIEIPFLEKARIYSCRRGINANEIAGWAWILSTQSPDEKMDHFSSVSSEMHIPLFVLKEILQGDLQYVQTLRKVLIYVWHQVLAKSPADISLWSSKAGVDQIPQSKSANSIIPPRPSDSPHGFFPREELSFRVLLVRLLHQARRIWPPAVVTISLMLEKYISSFLKDFSSNTVKVDGQAHRRYCDIFNQVLRLLSSPASIGPYRSMNHNWASQRNLLQLAGEFDPPLMLDQNSYRAVAQVLAASKKSERESKVVNLRARTWPPWRYDQNGMDAQRSPEEDISRVVLATMRTKEAGYPGSSWDEALQILGGQELDGSPTIQTRKLISLSRAATYNAKNGTDLAANTWATRIAATRDVQEAWAAFKSFLDKGGRPSLSLYHPMFEKLHYETIRVRRNATFDATPGDGREVLPPANENLSQSYRMRLQPPNVEQLYQHMIDSGIQPSGRCLDDLIQNATSIGVGLKYLRDSGVNREALAFMSGVAQTAPTRFLKMVSVTTFESFISLLCRFAFRTVKFRPGDDDPDTIIQNCDSNSSDPNNQWRIFGEFESDVGIKDHLIANPLVHAIKLIRDIRPLYRPAWYEIFSALARPYTIMHRKVANDPKNDFRAWKELKAALRAFLDCGLELDPRGFEILCQGCQKAMNACNSGETLEKQKEGVNAIAQLLREQWLLLSQTVEDHEKYQLPRLLHSVSPSTLHKYIRVLGRSKFHIYIMEVLKWMVEVHEELDEIAQQTEGGPRLFRTVLVSIRVILSTTDWEQEARECIESVEIWGGWPGEDECIEYLERRWRRLDWVAG